MVTHIAVGIALAVAVTAGVGLFIWTTLLSSPLEERASYGYRERTPGPSSPRIEPHGCTICLGSIESYARIVLKCGHNFHRNCHKKALEGGISRCPNCRMKTM